MLIFFIIGLAIAAVLLGICLVLGAIVAAATALMAAAGLVSSAALVGVLRGRFSSGLRAFHYQLLGAAGLVSGIGVLWIAQHLFDLHLSHRSIALVGAAAGAAAGLITARILDLLAVLAYRKLCTTEGSPFYVARNLALIS